MRPQRLISIAQRAGFVKGDFLGAFVEEVFSLKQVCILRIAAGGEAVRAMTTREGENIVHSAFKELTRSSALQSK